MAEGFARHFGGSQIAAMSAGLEAHGLNPRAVAAMREIGIDISRQQSTVIDAALLAAADIIVTVCDHAKEHCPIAPAHVRQLHWSFEDPAKAVGTEAEITSTFRRIRDEIGDKVRGLIGELYGQRAGIEA
jgi:arsenate reductase